MSKTFFTTAKRSFKDVPIQEDKQIPTTEFLEASESLVTLFGKSTPITSHALGPLPDG
jgi:hypothetical protein